MGSVWNQMIGNPDADIKDLLVRVLTPLCQRLNLMLREK
jgi:hypothetical protein